MIGDTTSQKRCRIAESTTGACDYYVKYSEDGGATWLGLSFEGVAGVGGTGCPGYGKTQATQTQAIAWLVDHHIEKGRCGCKARVATCEEWKDAAGTDLYSLALSPNMIGDTTSQKRCRIAESTTGACDYYVKYTEDGGATWLGLSFEGVAGVGGTGCPGYGKTQATQTQAIAWLVDHHIEKGRCGCKKQVACGDAGCRNTFDGLGMCLDTSTTDWGTMHKKIDFYAGTKDEQCSKDCKCTCFKHIGCTNKECSARKGTCVTADKAPPAGYIKSFPCDEFLDCFCYLKPSPPCKLHPKCKKKKGRCYSKTDTIPLNAKYLGYCNKKAGCKCYKTIDIVTMMTTGTGPTTPTPIIPCKTNKKCRKKKGKCYGKLTPIPGNAKYLGWCDKKMGCKCYKA